jgi:2-amino-4-hydroxy-6-hydroxymethyldihydropteridine diphosphokinase
MPRVYLSLGSNIEREQRIEACLDALVAHFGVLDVSSVYESDAVGFIGDRFFNLAVGLDTGLSVAELTVLLRDIEYANGRRRGETRFSGRTLDIDILTWGDACGVVDGIKLPREEILQNAFVLLPMAELAPDTLHPQVGKSYRDLWDAYDQASQRIWSVAFLWRGKACPGRMQ